MYKRQTWERGPDGFYTFTANNLKSFRREPDMPPDEQALPWILVYYGEDPSQVAKFWKSLAKSSYSEDQPFFKVTDEVKAAAAGIVGSAAGADAQLRALYDHCHRKIRNLGAGASDTTAEEREQKKKNRSPAEVLKAGVGRPKEIDYTFGALARALGFETRMARMGRRDQMMLDPGWPDEYFLTSYVVAVKTSDGWRMFDPGNDYIAYGMLEDVEEEQTALVPDPDDPGFIAIPASPPDWSRITRIATFTLSEDGTLEGDVRIESRGHEAAALKREIGTLAAADQVQHLARRTEERAGVAELNNVQIENANDPDQPVIERFQVRLPGYAQVTGRRLLIQPAVFQKALAPRYSDSKRRFPVQYGGTWSEFDSVIVRLPAGFQIDKVGEPSTHQFSSFGEYVLKLDELLESHSVRVVRRFSMNRLNFESDDYPALKTDFDQLHRQDAAVLVLARTGTGP